MKGAKILIILGIGCVVGLLLVFGIRLQAQNSAKKDSITTNVSGNRVAATPRMGQSQNRQQSSNWGGQRSTENKKKDDGSDYYKVIIDNNIFRPLGWKPPNREPEYTLIGITFDQNGELSKASIQEERSKKFYIAKVGDEIGEATVKEIEEKKVVLEKNGELITLKFGNMQLLKSGGTRRSNSTTSYASSNQNENNNNKSSSSRSSTRNKEDAEAKAKAAAQEKMKQEWMERAQQMRGRFERASPEERGRMMREFSGRRGRRGGDR